MEAFSGWLLFRGVGVVLGRLGYAFWRRLFCSGFGLVQSLAWGWFAVHLDWERGCNDVMSALVTVYLGGGWETWSIIGDTGGRESR